MMYRNGIMTSTKNDLSTVQTVCSCHYFKNEILVKVCFLFPHTNTICARPQTHRFCLAAHWLIIEGPMSAPIRSHV